MSMLSKTLCAAAVVGLVAIPFSAAQAWGGWSPRGNDYGSDWGPFDVDGFGDMDFNMSGSARGSGRGIGYGRGYGGGSGYGGGPYGYGGGPGYGAPYAYGAPYGAPAAPAAPATR